MKTSQKIKKIIEIHPEVKFMDGYDDCVIGICKRSGMDSVVLYDQEKVLKKLMKDNMTYEEALDFFEYNQLGAWVGNYTPAFADLMEN